MRHEELAPVPAPDPPPPADSPAAGIRVVDDWAIDGLSTIYERAGAVGRPEEVVEALRRHAVEAGLPLPAGRGRSDAFGWVLDLLRGRRLLRDHGEFPAVVDWLFLHAPPGGTASFTLEDASRDAAGVTLKLLGTGYGSGHGVTFSVKQSFLERSRCTRLSQHVTVRLRSWDVGRGPGHPELEPSVTGLRHLEVRTWETCPLCGRPPEELDPFEYVQAGPGLDLSEDEVGQRRTEVVHLSASGRAEVSLSLPVPGLGDAVGVGLSTEREIDLTCTTDYTFPPHAFFTPYRAAKAAGDPPFWAVR